MAVDAAGHHDDERRRRSDGPLERPRRRIETDRAEPVETDRTVVDAAEHGTRGRAHDHPAPIPGEADEDRCRDLDRDLERLAVVRVGTGVEHHDDVGLPVRRVLTDEELARPRSRGPVDLAQVVADLVLTQRRELVAVERHRPGADRVGRRAQPASSERG